MEETEQMPGENPYFSVVVPACGCARYLPEVFACLEAQAFHDFEVLFAVEECTDGSLDLCRAWAEGRRAQVGSLPRSGSASASRNWCLDHARGRYLVPLDGDDWWDADALERLHAALVKADEPDLATVSARICLEHADGTRSPGGEIANLDAGHDGEVMTGRQLIRLVGRSGHHARNYAALSVCRRDFLLKNGLRQVPGLACEDTEWTPRVWLAADRILFLARPYYNYRRHSESITTRSDARYLKDLARAVVSLSAHLDGLALEADVRRPLSNDLISVFFWFLFNPLYRRRFSAADRRAALRTVTADAATAAHFRALGACASRVKRLGMPLVRLAAKTGWLLPAALFFRLYYRLTAYKMRPRRPRAPWAVRRCGLVPQLAEVYGWQVLGILSRKPLVLAVYDWDFLQYAEAFLAQAAAVPDLAVVVQIGFSPRSQEEAAKLAAGLLEFRKKAPRSRVVLLANSPAERETFAALGVTVEFCHQNAFVDERRFRPFRVKKRFDAVYVARMTPFKRHELMAALDPRRLLLLSTPAIAPERDYEKRILALLPGVTRVTRFRNPDASVRLAPCACGLALSAHEGAMFASAEYLLSGLPVVNTPSIGGREEVFPPEYVTNVDATPEAVAAAVRRWAERPADPRAVRAAFLARVAPHRAKLREILRGFGVEISDTARFPHKLGVRTPLPLPFGGLLVWGWLFLRGLQLRLGKEI